MSSAVEQVFVVGGAGALGSAIVRRLLAEGFTPVVVGRSETSLRTLADSLPGVGYCVADLSSDEAIDSLRAKATGIVRGVVHAAGVPVAGGVLDAPVDALVEAVNVKVGGMLRLIRAVSDNLVAGSRLIAIGGHYGFEPTAYAATAGVANAALANLVRQLSWAWGDKGITAHLIAPGPADTERLRRVAAHRAERDGLTSDEVLREMRGESAINAFTTPEQVAWAVSTLLAPEADALAGSTLFMDAGRRRGLP